jgi:hypothetical protein
VVTIMMPAQVSTNEKRCRKCGEFWPADTQFYSPDSSAKDGLHGQCKACCSDYKRAVRGQSVGRPRGVTDGVAAALARALRPQSARSA